MKDRESSAPRAETGGRPAEGVARAPADDGRTFDFDVFASYSTDPDYRLVRKVESFLESFHRMKTPAEVELRPLEVCVDGSDFELGRSGGQEDGSRPVSELISRNLERSRYLLLFCSAKAARSTWVDQEIRWFLENRGAESILLAITEGTDPGAAAEEIFSPRVLEAGLHERPWYDFRKARGREGRGWEKVKELDDEQVRLAAHLNGRSAGDVLPLWYRETRRSLRRRLLVAVAAAIVLLVSAIVAFLQRDVARWQASQAEAGLLAEKASRSLSNDPPRALALALEGARLAHSDRPLLRSSPDDHPGASLPAERALRASLALAHLDTVLAHQDKVDGVWFTPDGRQVVTADDQALRFWSAEGELLSEVPGTSFTPSPDGRWIVARGAQRASVLDGQTGEEIAGLGRVAGGEVVFAEAADRAVLLPLGADPLLWDRESGRAVLLEGHGGGARSAAFSPDGSQLATGGGDRTVRLWSAVGELLSTWADYEQPIHALAFSRDGTYLAAAGGKTPILRSVTPATRLALAGHGAAVVQMIFSRDGRRIVTNGNDHTTRLWDTATGRELASIPDHGDSFWRVVADPLFERFVTGGRDGRLRLWDFDTGRRSQLFEGHAGRALSARFSADGGRLVAGATDRTVRVWSTETGKALAVLRGHRDEVRDIALSPDGSHLASAGRDATARVWTPGAGQQLIALSSGGAKTWIAHLSRDGSTVVAGGEDGGVRVVSVASGAPLVVGDAHAARISAAAFSPDGRRVATGDFDGLAIVWDVGTGELAARLEGHRGTLADVAFSPDGERLVTGGFDGTARLWDPIDGRQLALLDGHDGAVTRVGYSPDGREILTGSADATAAVWDDATGARRLELAGHRRLYRGGVDLLVGFAPDGRRIVSGGIDGTVRIWNAFTGEEEAMLEGRSLGDEGPHFSADGRSLVTLAADGSVRLRDLRSAAERRLLPNPLEDASGVRISADGRRIAVESRRGSVRLFDARRGEVIADLDDPLGPIHHLEFSGDGARLLTVGQRGVRVHFTSLTAEALEHAESRLPATLSAATREAWVAAARGTATTEAPEVPDPPVR